MTDRARESLLVAALAVLPLLPFLDKAVCIDGPVFVAVAHQILESPLDPFGFQMVWDPTSVEAAEFNRNPPLLSYYLALWMTLFGDAEVVLHAAVLPFPLIAALSFLGIARRLVDPQSGFASTALLVTTPAFVVLATTLMLDIPMLACLLAAVYALLRGREPGGGAWLWGAGFAAAATGLMKYIGFCAAPLLAAGALLLCPRPTAALLRVLAPPVVIWGVWGAWTAHLYGSVHFLGSSDVVLGRSLDPDEFWNQIVSTPIYYGGALVFPLVLWVRSLLRGRGGSELAVAGILVGTAVAYWVLPEGEPPRRHPIQIEETVFAAASFAAGLFLWGFLLLPRRLLEGPETRFLGLWIGGHLLFTLFLNWHVNAADALLAAPPVLLLLFRDAELRPPKRLVVVCVALALPLSVLLALADAVQANFYREAARRAVIEIGTRSGARWFVGHWGLQHYFEEQGFEAVLPPQYGRSDLAVDDWVATARNVSQLDVSKNMQRYRLREIWAWEKRHWLPLRTTNADASAGFYSHHAGYVPYAWSREPVERVQLGRVVRAFRAPASKSGAVSKPRPAAGPAAGPAAQPATP